ASSPGLGTTFMMLPISPTLHHHCEEQGNQEFMVLLVVAFLVCACALTSHTLPIEQSTLITPQAHTSAAAPSFHCTTRRGLEQHHHQQGPAPAHCTQGICQGPLP